MIAELLPFRVEYQGADSGAAPIVVERLAAEDVDEALASSIIRVNRDAYAAQFGDTMIPRRVIMQQLNPDDSSVVAERQRLIRKRIEDGRAQYWVSWDEEGTALRGLSKVMPMRGMVYVGDVMVAPPWRGGVGTRLLHAPLVYDGHPDSSRVELDAFEGSSVNRWYVKLGFKPTVLEDSFEMGDYSLLTRRLVVPSTIGLRGLVRRMEQQTPALTKRRVLPAGS